MTTAGIVLGLLVVQRLGELLLAAFNTRRLRALGAFEIDAGGYPWIVALHTAWLLALFLQLAAEVSSWSLLLVFAALQLGRVWVITSLGRRWTTRIIVLPNAPVRHVGPYRYLRHPNYAIVAAEIVLLPLAFGAVWTALVVGVANAALLARRVRIEDRALAPARSAPELASTRGIHYT